MTRRTPRYLIEALWYDLWIGKPVRPATPEEIGKFNDLLFQLAKSGQFSGYSSTAKAYTEALEGYKSSSPFLKLLSRAAKMLVEHVDTLPEGHVFKLDAAVTAINRLLEPKEVWFEVITKKNGRFLVGTEEFLDRFMIDPISIKLS